MSTGPAARIPTTVDEVAAGLRSARTATFERAVAAAVGLGADGDRLLAGLDDLRGWRAVTVTAALGDVDGPHGGQVLRRRVAARGPGTSDVRCAALLALTKRREDGVDTVLADALDDPDRVVREYALIGLAAVGDDRCWDDVLRRLSATLSRTRTTVRGDDLSPVVTAVIYLLRHARHDPARADVVASLLRRRLNRLDESERRWLDAHWPAFSAGTAPPLPDTTAMHESVLRDPLLSRTGAW